MENEDRNNICLTNAFCKLHSAMNHNLPNNIWKKIESKEKKEARMKLSLYSLFALSSLLAFVLMVKVLIRDLSNSGFYEYISLALSNTGTLALYWKEFVYSLAESLPTLSIIVSFILIFIFFFSIKYGTKQIIKSRLELALQ